MVQHHACTDYYWLKGKPKGRGALAATKVERAPVSFRIIDDPYGKRYSVERYRFGIFDEVLYDSLLLDFRHLKPIHQQAWNASKDASNTYSLVRDQNDRIVYLEQYDFCQDLCCKCHIYSPQKQLLSTHRIYYTQLGDPVNAVVLFDLNQRPVMYKRYQADANGLFTELLEEQWNLRSGLPQIFS